MRIAQYSNIDLHWWGKNLLLIRNIGEYYIFEDEEVFFVEHLCKTNVVADLVYNIACELDVDSVTVENFINIFMENFADYFYFSTKETARSIRISGENRLITLLKYIFLSQIDVFSGASIATNPQVLVASILTLAIYPLF